MAVVYRVRFCSASETFVLDGETGTPYGGGAGHSALMENAMMLDDFIALALAGALGALGAFYWLSTPQPAVVDSIYVGEVSP